jgi:hypothetical protein
MVGVISSWRTLVGVALLAPLQLSAQTAERPELRPGERWRFVEYQTVPSTQPNREWIITRADANGFEGQLAGRMRRGKTRTLGARTKDQRSALNSASFCT